MASHSQSAFDRESLVSDLVRAHSSGIKIIRVPPVPDNPAVAMGVQSLVQKRLGKPVEGWKVAIGPQQLPIAAPLLDIRSDGSEICASSNCLIEVELAVRLSEDIPSREDKSYSRRDVLASIDSVLLGIELVDGRFDRTAAIPFLTFLADHLGNRAFIVGDCVSSSAVDGLDGRGCHVTLNDRILHEAPAIHPAGDPLLPLVAYANAQIDELGGLRAGQVVTTGSLCGVLPAGSTGRLMARLGGLGKVSASFVI